MAGPEQGGGEQEAQAELQELMQQLGPLLEILQGEGSPEDKLNAARKVLEILEKLKAAMGEEAFYQNEQFVQIEQFVGQVMGQLEG